MTVGTPPPPWDESLDTGTTGALADISMRLSRIETIEAERSGATRMLSRLVSIFGAAITAGAIGLGGWVWAVSDEVSETATTVQHSLDLIERHETRGGPGGHPDAVTARVAENAGRVLSLETSITGMRDTLREQGRKLDLVLERLPRRR